jgi:hypothetical protein
MQEASLSEQHSEESVSDVSVSRFSFLPALAPVDRAAKGERDENWVIAMRLRGVGERAEKLVIGNGLEGVPASQRRRVGASGVDGFDGQGEEAELDTRLDPDEPQTSELGLRVHATGGR